jgi:hypothetical protein
MRAPLLACLCLVISGCPTDSSAPQTAAAKTDAQASAAKPWPRLKAIIIADLTAPENRPVDLEAEEDKAVRGALTAPGRFHSALSKDPGACAIEVRTFYGLLVNGELTANADQGKAKVVMEAEAHCPTQGRSDGEVESYRTTLFREAPFSNVDGDPSTDGVAALRTLLVPLSEQVAITLYGQVTVRHADDDAVVAALGSDHPAGVLMEAAGEAGERKLLGALDSLVALTRHEDDVVVLRAGAALGLLGVAEDHVITALAEMTEGPDHERHLIAVHAMGDIGGRRAARYLDTLAVGHPRPALREAARQAAKRAKARTTKADTGDRSRHDAPPGTGAERP